MITQPQQDAGAPGIICYRLTPRAVELRPGVPGRAWMDATQDSFAYRCLPLTIANACGWELVLPCEVVAEWNGGPAPADLKVTVTAPEWQEGRLAASHFGHGVLTFHTGYMFRTPPGISLLVRGAPNWPRPIITPLDGVVETDWLPFSFTMNWVFTVPGRIRMRAGDPFGFVMPVELARIEAMSPHIVPIDSAPEEAARYREWATARNDFTTRLMAREPDAMQQRWQKWYTRGTLPDGTPSPQEHRSKLKLKKPSAS